MVALLVLNEFPTEDHIFGETLRNSDLSLINHTIGSLFHINLVSGHDLGRNTCIIIWLLGISYFSLHKIFF